MKNKSTHPIEDTTLLQPYFYLPRRRRYTKHQKEANRAKQMDESRTRRQTIKALAEANGVSYLVARRIYLAS